MKQARVALSNLYQPKTRSQGPSCERAGRSATGTSPVDSGWGGERPQEWNLAQVVYKRMRGEMDRHATIAGESGRSCVIWPDAMNEEPRPSEPRFFI
jgi:hypothetical protein